MATALSTVHQQLVGIAGETSSALDEKSVQLLASLYRTHIERENRELLPISRRLLNRQAIEDLSRAMTARRR
jgi:hemerythrin-like domain-containing protein